MARPESCCRVEADAPDFTVALPSANAPERLVLYEEAATLWAWAWPELIGWKLGVNWLFSPVVGQKWPGDLWGIDSSGSMLLVESKRANAPQDPLRDFVGYLESSPLRGTNPLLDAELIRSHWSQYRVQELRFIETHLESLRNGVLPLRRHPGIVPYSRKRLLVRRWASLYTERIAPRVSSYAYVTEAEQWLARRSRISTPSVHFFGLFAVEGEEIPRLSAAGRRNWRQMLEAVGPGRIHWRAFSANRTTDAKVEIRAWAPSFDDA
jgi:hypothetical protein